jgi:hypothetical protein
MRIEFRITKATDTHIHTHTHTHRIRHTYCFSMIRVVTRTCLTVIWHVHSPVCFVTLLIESLNVTAIEIYGLNVFITALSVYLICLIQPPRLPIMCLFMGTKVLFTPHKTTEQIKNQLQIYFQIIVFNRSVAKIIWKCRAVKWSEV